MRYLNTVFKQATFIVACITILFMSGVSFGQTVQSVQASPLRPNFGGASNYAVYTGSGTITNTGLSVLTGDIGTDAGSIKGFPPGIYSGSQHIADASTALAKKDLGALWTTEAAVACDFVLGVGIADGQSFDPAVYCSGGATTTSGNITFNAHGDANAIFIVKIGGQLSANAGTHILLSNNARAANIYWFVDGAVNVADNSSFKGTIFARGAISFLGTSSLDGRALVGPAGAINIAANKMSISTDSATVNNLTVVKPANGDTLKGKTQNYQITWSGSGIDNQKKIEYSLDSGKTWKTIIDTSTTASSYNWNIVPDTNSTKAIIRVTDKNNLSGQSGIFTITSTKPNLGAIVVLTPATGEIVNGKMQNYQITWTGTGIASQKTFHYSLDGGLTWTLIGSMTADGFSYGWNVPDTASTMAMVRITDANGAIGKSGIFIIKSGKPGPGTIVVLTPGAGETVNGKTQNYQITWTGSNIALQKTFDYSLDGGLTWTMIGSMTADGFSYGWNVPDTATNMAMVRITDANGTVGKSGIFIIKSGKPNPGTIIVVRPALGETIAGGMQNYQIMWSGTNIATIKTFEYSLDGGYTWNFIGVLSSDQFSASWANVPNEATTQGLIRITDANNVSGTSGMFTITKTPGVGSINSLTLTGLDNARNIKNNMQLGINWTFTPDIGTSMEVEYSLDYTLTWVHIATIPTPTTETAGSTSWMTTPTGYHNPVFIRITSSNGMTRTSQPFSIGSNAGVAYTSQKDGYALANYPNPVSGETNISFVLPVATDITISISDGLGREVANVISQHFDAGTHNASFNASKLSAGMYNYTLKAGTTVLVGRMIVVK